MARVNPTEFALLGLLAESPRSGYDIKRDVEERLSHFWSESYGHLYPMLARLRRRGLIDQAVERAEGRPDRKVYSITEEGRAALTAWFAEPPSGQSPRNELLLRVFLGRHARPEHLIRDVREQRSRFEAMLVRLRSIERRLAEEAATEPDRLYWDLTIEYGLKALEPLIAWADEAESALRKHAAGEPRAGDGRGDR